jgi:hypothetical protein
MLTRLIVDVYAWLIEIFLWFTLLMSGVAGYYYTVPMLKAAQLILVNETGWRIYGALLLPVATFLVLAVLTGPVLVLVDIRKAVRALEANNGGTINRVLPAEPREPTL